MGGRDRNERTEKRHSVSEEAKTFRKNDPDKNVSRSSRFCFIILQSPNRDKNKNVNMYFVLISKTRLGSSYKTFSRAGTRTEPNCFSCFLSHLRCSSHTLFTFFIPLLFTHCFPSTLDSREEHACSQNEKTFVVFIGHLSYNSTGRIQTQT